MIRYAVFDLDETLTCRGTWGRFVNRSVRRRPWRWLRIWLRAFVRQIFYKMGSLERIDVKQAMLQASLTGQSRVRLEKLAFDFARRECAQGLCPEAVKTLEVHRAAGDRIILATASADLIANAIAKELGIQHVVATKLAWEHKNGIEVCADHFDGENCYGEGKLTALTSHLETFPDYQRADVYINMYSDSVADLPCLRFANKAVVVNPNASLQAAASKYGFEVQNWPR